MKPLKILSLLLFIVIVACENDTLEIIETKKGTAEQIESCETAFAKKPADCSWDGYVFSSNKKSNPDGYKSLNLTRNRWGWAVNVTGRGSAVFPLWAGAAKNDTSKGTQVGEVRIKHDGTNRTILNFRIFEGYIMKELHIYAKDTAPTTIAPGQYGYTREFNDGTFEHDVEFDVQANPDGSGFWIIAHAVVCDSAE